MRIESARYVGGFAKAIWLKGADIRPNARAAAAIAKAEPDILEHMNTDHADAVDHYANALLGRSGNGWKMTGLDPDGFDLVLCIGVLEYAGSDPGAFLSHLASLVRPGGALVIAIENQMGLAYWLGADEDHLGRPFVGLSGYPGDTGGIRTHSRAGLAGLLSDAGMSAQRWLYPFPTTSCPWRS